MSIFTLKLTEEQHAALEAYRAGRGLRSKAEAVRHLIMHTMPLVYTRFPGVEAPYPADFPQPPEQPAISFGPQRPKPGDRLKKSLSK